MGNSKADARRVEIQTTETSVTDYVGKITKAWNKSREGIFECGNYLRQAKQDLPHGQYEKMIKDDLPFGKGTAAKLKAIAEYRPFHHEGVMQHLPVSWGTLYELHHVDENKFSLKFSAGKIYPDMTRDEAIGLRAKDRSSKSVAALNALSVFNDPNYCNVTDLTELTELKNQFAVVYADPPWDYYSADKKGNPAPYPTMKMAEIKQLPVKQAIAADNAHLFLWVTSPLLDKGIEVMREWGFSYKASFVWVKPNRAIALGNYWDNSHEILLLGVRGKDVAFRDKALSHIVADADDVHSRKPNEVRDMIEKVGLAGPRIELFARQRHDGWVAWGNEIFRDHFDEAKVQASELVSTEDPSVDGQELEQAA